MSRAAAPHQPSGFIFDREGARTFHVALDIHLAALAKEFGIAVATVGTMGYDPVAKTLRVRIEATAGEETARARFAVLAPAFGLDPSDFGREYKGDPINGISSSGRITVEVSGKTLRYRVKDTAAIVAALHPEDAAARSRTARIATGNAAPADWNHNPLNRDT